MKISGYVAAMFTRNSTIKILISSWLITQALAQTENVSVTMALHNRPNMVADKKITSWKELRNQHIVPQKLDYSCGSAALATLLTSYWNDSRFKNEGAVVAQIKKHLSVSELHAAVKNGFSFLHLQQVCQALGYHAEAYVDVPPDSFAQIDLPVIVRIKRGKDWHFVVVNGLPDGRMLVLDPVLGNIVMPLSKFTGMWDGRALEVQHATRPQPASNPLTKLAGGIIAAPLNYSSQQLRSNKAPGILKR